MDETFEQVLESIIDLVGHVHVEGRLWPEVGRMWFVTVWGPRYPLYGAHTDKIEAARSCRERVKEQLGLPAAPVEKEPKS